MHKKTPPIQFEEIPGDHYPNLLVAQRLAAAELAGALATTIRSLLADELLIVDGGRIILTPRKESTNE